MRFDLIVEGRRYRMTKHVARRCWDVATSEGSAAATLFLTRSGKVWAIEGDYQLGRRVAAAAGRVGIVAG